MIILVLSGLFLVAIQSVIYRALNRSSETYNIKET